MTFDNRAKKPDDKQFREAQARDLDEILNHQPSSEPSHDGQSLDPRDAALAREMAALAVQGLPVDARFYHQLAQKLQSAAVQKRRINLFTSVWARVLASALGMAILLGLVLFSAPLLQHLLGRAEPTPTTPVAGGPVGNPIAAPQGPTETVPMVPTALPGEPPTTATPEITQPAGKNGWTLAAKLPDGPQQVPLYLQTTTGEALTPQSAQQMAERLGVKGAVYQNQGEGGGTSYLVSDGKTSVLFFGTTILEFTYMASYPAGNAQAPLPFEQQARIAEEWLSARGLADFPHQIQPVLTDPTRVAVVRELENGRQYAQNAYDPPINLRISPAGQVTAVVHRPLNLEAKGSQALRSASEAWDALTAGLLDKKLFYQTLDFSQQYGLKQWIPSYAPGQTVHLYGYASSVQAVDSGQPPHLEVANIPMSGDAALLAQVPMRKMLHVWGLYQIDAQGRDSLELQGWEYSPLQEVGLSGQLVQANGGIQFQSEQGQQYNLLNLPADVPQGVKLNVSGVQSSPQEIIWRMIETQIGPENYQTTGMLPLMDQPTDPNQPQLPETGHKPGDKIEALEGTSRGVIWQEADGSQTLERMLMTTGWFARLEGPGAVGIEKYYNLPVKVWGTYQEDGANIIIVVDRYEPLLPDVKIEVYFGTISEKVLEGKNVFILNGENGQQWVIQSSINFTQALANQGWDNTTQLAVEGYLSPDKKTYGGLPVLVDLSQAMLNIKGHTKENYQPYTNQPQVEQRPEGAFVMPKNATIEQVELVYYANELRGPIPQEESGRRLQPLWRFSGHLQDGRPFEVLVKAEKEQ